MNSTTCWYCEKIFEYEDPKYRDVKCPHCGVENDVMDPNKPDYLPPGGYSGTTESEWLDKEEDMPNVNDLKPYLCPSDVKDGDILTFMDAGEFLEKDFSKEQDGSDVRTALEITIELPNGKTKKYTPNSKTMTALAEGYGSPETETWVGKKASVIKVKQQVFGQFKDVIYLESIK